MKSVPSHSSYNAVQFTRSNWNQDGYQSTIPFIDVQDVVLQSPVPLSGIGIYHKGYGSYGGFLAPRIFTHNYQDFI